MKMPLSAAPLFWLAFVVVLVIALAQLNVLGWIRHGFPPRIHDLTTDLGDPPRFRPAPDGSSPARRQRPYPHGGNAVPRLQRAAYPDLAPIRSALAPKAAFERALDIARAMGWKVVWSDAQEGQIEATATTRWFRFVDDIAIRVRPASGGSVIDLRSISRAGVGDLGANTARIRRFKKRFSRP